MVVIKTHLLLIIIFLVIFPAGAVSVVTGVLQQLPRAPRAVAVELEGGSARGHRNRGRGRPIRGRARA